MKCHYCSQECEPVEGFDYYSLLKEECRNHKYLVRAFCSKNEPSLVNYTFYPFYKDKKFKISIVIKDGKTSCTISCASTYTSPIKEEVVTFDFDPGITPENVLKKLPTILTFL